MDSPGAPPARRTKTWIGAALVLAAAVRLVPWPAVFTTEGVRFVADGDPYYHVLRARVLAREHRVLWRDPGLDAPFGADVPWPPLFDAILAAPAWVAGGATPAENVVDTAAALVPIALALLGVLAGALLARELLGDSGAVATAFLLALLPVNASYGVVGRPDQHVLEALLLTAMLLVLAREGAGRRAGARLAAPIALGALITAAFWTWQGSALLVAVLCALVAAEHVLARGDDAGRWARTVGLGSLVAAATMAITAGLLGPPRALRRVAIEGVTAFPVILAGGAALWCIALARARRRRPDAGLVRRAGEALAAAAALAGAMLLASAGVRAAVLHGLTAAGRSSAWHGAIAEYAPIFTPGDGLLPQASGAFLKFGLFPLLAAAGVLELLEWWRRGDRRPAAILVGTIGLSFTALTAHMVRFAYYAAVPLALFAAMGLSLVARRAARFGRTGAVAATVSVAAVAFGSAVPGLLAAPRPPARLEAIGRAVAPLRDAPPGGSILVRWDAGHHARFFSGRGVVASPFGTDLPPDSMADAAAFFLAVDPAATEALLARRDVRWVALDDPANAVLEAVALAGSPSPPVVRIGDPLRGFHIHCEEWYDRLVVARLYYHAGGSTPADPVALGGFRLIADQGDAAAPLRLFEIVRGAEIEVRGAVPGARVVARTSLTTRFGSFGWAAWGTADGSGRAELRVPFATGRNGETWALAYALGDGSRSSSVSVSERDVRSGARVTADLAAAPAPAARRGG